MRAKIQQFTVTRHLNFDSKVPACLSQEGRVLHVQTGCNKLRCVKSGFGLVLAWVFCTIVIIKTAVCRLLHSDVSSCNLGEGRLKSVLRGSVPATFSNLIMEILSLESGGGLYIEKTS